MTPEEKRARNNAAVKRFNARKRVLDDALQRLRDDPDYQDLPNYQPGMADERRNIESSLIKLSSVIAPHMGLMKKRKKDRIIMTASGKITIKGDKPLEDESEDDTITS